MEKVLEKYFQNKKHVQLIIREKQMEGVIESIQDGVVHLIDEKHEYHFPIEKIVSIACKLDKKDRKEKSNKNSPLGFKLA